MIVMKFGGSSLESYKHIQHVIKIVKKSLGKKPVLVCSAFGGITDQLIKLADMAVDGKPEWEKVFQHLSDRHFEAVRMLVPPQMQTDVTTQIKTSLNELEDVLHGTFLLKEYTPRSLDYIMSFGERLSAYIISKAFTASGIPAHYADARLFIRTNNRFGAAQVDLQFTNQLIQEYFRSVDILPVVTGFIAATPEGQTTTLG